MAAQRQKNVRRTVGKGGNFRSTKSVSKETPVTWKGVGSRKSAVVAEKRRVGMGNRTSSIRKKSKKQ